MRAACRSVILAVLIYSTAVSSSSYGDLSTQEDLDLKNIANNVVDESENDLMSCTTCKMLSMKMKEIFESTKREDMIDQVLQGCNRLDQDMSETCANMVFNYFDYFYDFMKDQLQSNEICAVSGICAGNDWNRVLESMKFPMGQDKFYCDECMKIAKHLHESAIKTTEAEFKAKLTGMCKLSPILQLECKRIVDQYSHILYLITKTANPEKICLVSRICDKKSNGIKTNELQQPPKFHLKCIACKDIFNGIKYIVSKFSSKEKIKKAMHMLCDKLIFLSRKCHSLVDIHSDDIIRLSRNAKYFCFLIGLCSSSDEFKQKEMFLLEQIKIGIKTSLPEEQKQVSESICAIWKQIVQESNELVRSTPSVNFSLGAICEMVLTTIKQIIDTQDKQNLA